MEEPNHAQALLAFDRFADIPAMLAKDLRHQLPIKWVVVNYQRAFHGCAALLSAAILRVASGEWQVASELDALGSKLQLVFRLTPANAS